LYSRYFDPVKHQPSPSKSINIIQQTAWSLFYYRSERPITTIDIKGIYGTNILQTGLRRARQYQTGAQTAVSEADGQKKGDFGGASKHDPGQGKSFLWKIITMDESTVTLHMPETKKQYKQ
jgi:hypothetical protein